MLSNVQQKFQSDIKKIKRRYKFLLFKWCLLFLLPILIIILAYHVSKQFLKLNIQAISNKIKESNVKERNVQHEPDSEKGT